MSALHSQGIATALSVAAALQIPMDAASITIYILLAGAVLLIWYGDRRSKRARREEENQQRSEKQEEAVER